MEKTFLHSQEDVRAIQDSFQMYSTSISISQAASSQRRDVFQVFFEALEEQKSDLEPHKSYLRGKVPLYYQQDLEQAFTPSAGAVAMETSTMTTGIVLFVWRCSVVLYNHTMYFGTVLSGRDHC